MKQICFVLPEGIVMPSTMFAAMEVFEAANAFLLQKDGYTYYDIKFIGTGVSQPFYNSQLIIQPTYEHQTTKPDLIIIPGLHWHNNYSIKENAEIINWIINLYNTGCELASLCTGSFFLAATGLLNGMECSCHWKGEDMFTEMYPDVKLCTDKIMTDKKGIYTSGGAYSSLNLMLYLIQKYNGREAALYCAKVLQIDIERNSQAPFMLFKGQKEHGDVAVREVQEFIERNIQEKITIELLSKKFAMSKRSLIRRFVKATGNAPIEYTQKIKIEAAKRRLELNEKNINEIMYSVGYADVKAFRNMFKKIAGLTPVEYKAKFSYTA